MRRALPASIALVACAAACGDPEPATAVMVVVTMDAQVRVRADLVRVEVWGRDADEEAFVDASEQSTLGGPGDDPIPSDGKIVIPIVPANDDVERRWRVQVTVEGGAAAIGRVGAISGFVRHEVRMKRLHIAASCIALACSDRQRCDGATCVTVTEEDASALPVYDATVQPPDAGVPDAGADPDGGTIDGGSDAGSDRTGATCAEIRSRFPDAVDGLYMIDVDGPGVASPFEVYCHDMATATPKEYLDLGDRGAAPNCSAFAGGGGCPCEGFALRCFTRIRLNPAPLSIDASDTTFSTWRSSTTCFEAMSTSGCGHYASLGWGVAGSCVGPMDTSGTANIDLTETPFRVAESPTPFMLAGYEASGVVLGDDGRPQVIDLIGGGNCGFYGLTNPGMAPSAQASVPLEFYP